jgi:histidinol-phosphate aminotransferase
VTAFDLVPRYENLVVVRTFSKAAGLAGVRLGYMLTQPQNADFLRRVKPMYEINGLALRLGQYLIRNDHLLYEYAKQANEGRKYLQREFSRLGGRPFESHANFVVCRLPPGSNIPGLVSALRDRGYLIKGGFSEPPLADCIRVSTASPATLEGFVRVFELIYKEFVPTA